MKKLSKFERDYPELAERIHERLKRGSRTEICTGSSSNCKDTCLLSREMGVGLSPVPQKNPLAKDCRP